MSRALKPGFRSLATLKLVVNIGEHSTETKSPYSTKSSSQMGFIFYQLFDNAFPVCFAPNCSFYFCSGSVAVGNYRCM